MSKADSNHTAVLARQVAKAVDEVPVFDIHTHLYDASLGHGLLLWGIDELLVYHYLVAEAFRYFSLPYKTFWRMPRQEQADLIWKNLFVDHSPVSEACRGVITTLHRLGLDARKKDLPSLRKWFAQWKAEDYVHHVLELACVRRVCMTNSPFDDQERPQWEQGFQRDSRFVAALRIDPLLLSWPETSRKLKQWGYRVSTTISSSTLDEVRRFLSDWTNRLNAQYLMVSLPPDFNYPDQTPCSKIIACAVLPFCQERQLPFALMPGVKRAVNPELQLAGDGVGMNNLEPFERLFSHFPQNKFLLTALSRENQHALCVIARKFRNLHLFGCWWFTNIPSLIDEISRLRFELLGMSFTPQHSDARVLDQLIYKWSHTREILARVLTDKYLALAQSGWKPSSAEIQRDIHQLLGGAFETFCATTF